MMKWSYIIDWAVCMLECHTTCLRHLAQQVNYTICQSNISFEATLA